MQQNLENTIVMSCYTISYLIISLPAAYAVEQTFYVDGRINGSNGIITSPGYSSDYPHSVHYTWILRTGRNDATVNFTILDFDIKKHDYYPCDDYLQIIETKPFERQALKRCGRSSPFNLSVRGAEIAISFVSDEKSNAKGFYLTWRVNLPELITTLMTTTPLITTCTTMKTLTTILSTSLRTTKRTTLATTPSTLKTTFMSTTTQPSSTPLTSLHVSSTLNNPTTKTAMTQNEETSSILVPTTKSTETTTSITNFTKIQTVTTKNSNSTEGKRTPSLNPKEITYLILGISVVEIILIATGICIIKRRKKDSSSSIKANSRVIQVDKVRPYFANVYESIPLDHFSHGTIMEEEEEEDKGGVYIDFPEHVYDRSFVRRPHFKENTNVYQLMSELKNRKC